MAKPGSRGMMGLDDGRVRTNKTRPPVDAYGTLAPDGGGRLRLIVLSFLMLFVELALIRWTGSQVVYLSYFSNFVLLGSFLGVGIGFLRAKAKLDLFSWSAFALAAFVLFVSLFPAYIDRSGSDLIFFGHFNSVGLPIWVMLPLIFLAAAGIMAMVTEGVARQFARFPALEAYRLDVMGSLLGIAAFSLLSFLQAPPAAWGLVVATTYAWLWLAKRPAIHTMAGVAALLVLVAPLAHESMQPNDRWSPYYKVHYDERADGSVDIRVNGIPHQEIQTVEQRRQREPIYFRPYEHLAGNATGKQLLIVGAGTGSDVAIALSQGVAHIDAVEIDPVLQDIGARMHPDRPYDDPRVSVHINDGRAFLEQSTTRYDIVLFALPDSLTLVSGQSSLRLESYLFTVEALGSVRDHLAPGGVFSMYNFYRESWLIDRLAATMQEAFGQPPCVDILGEQHLGLAVLSVSPDPAALDCTSRWVPPVNATPPATDDRPFLYLREPGIPSFYLVTIVLILVAAVVFVRVGSGPLTAMRGYSDLFFMGAAFLLLETKNVVQFALLFGTTWFVNALVFGGVLLTVLAAIEVSRHVRFRRPYLIYAALLVSLVIAWLVPASTLVALPAAPRFLLASVVAFTPIFLANLVFAERFRATSDSPAAFGANLLGAMVGGVLEYAALVTGFHALLVLAALLYGLAFWLGRKHLGEAPLATAA